MLIQALKMNSSLTWIIVQKYAILNQVPSSTSHHRVWL